MDFSKWIICVLYLAVICICSYGLAMPLLEDEVNGMFAPEETFEPNDVPEYGAPDLAINDLTSDDVENILKRGFRTSDSYHRFPRIKERRIIPFYSYGNNYGFYKPRPRYVPQPMPPAGYSPWNMDYNNYNGRFRSRGSSRY
ncbi:hypothetical protein ACF0H5_011345 [Mactra antiquata]